MLEKTQLFIITKLRKVGQKCHQEVIKFQMCMLNTIKIFKKSICHLMQKDHKHIEIEKQLIKKTKT